MPHVSARRVATGAVVALALILAVVAYTSRSASARVPSMPGADAGRGARVIESFGCGACHTIDGIDGADAHVGPPLEDLARRRVIAGRLRNTPHNLTLWISHPQRVDPGNVMPDLGLTTQQAADIALYLYRHP